MPGDLTNPGRVTLGHPGVDRICGGVEQQREIVAVPAPRARVSAGGQDIPGAPHGRSRRRNLLGARMFE